MNTTVLASPASMPLNIRNLRVSLSPVKQHHVLFYSPVLKALVVPYAVQLDTLFTIDGWESSHA